MASLRVLASKINATIRRESVAPPTKRLSMLYGQGLPIKGTALKVKISKGAGDCQHIKIEVYTASDMVLRRTLLYTLEELKFVLEMDIRAEFQLLSQMKKDVLANADQPLSVITTAVEAETYRI